MRLTLFTARRFSTFIGLPQEDEEKTQTAPSNLSAASDVLPISSEALQQVVQTFQSSSTRAAMIAQAERLFFAESFRFLAAILDWEALPNDKGTRRTKTLKAYKILATFVESGSMFENNMSAKTKETLLQTKAENAAVEGNFFAKAKLEVIWDILHNPVSKAVLFQSPAQDATLPAA